MSDVDIGKLKVVELKAELQARGLDTKGNKAVLVKRLQDAIDSSESGGNSGAAITSVDEGDESQSSATNLGGSGDDSCNQDDDSSKQCFA
ncbi:hypothetical protein MTO96_012482 [Rhipicephalus appendiculatus]